MTSTQQSTHSGLIIVPFRDANPLSNNQSATNGFTIGFHAPPRAQPIEDPEKMRSAHLLRRGTADYPAGRKINPEKCNVIIWPVSKLGLSAIGGSILSSHQLKSGHSSARDESVGRRPSRIFKGLDRVRAKRVRPARAREQLVAGHAARKVRAVPALTQTTCRTTASGSAPRSRPRRSTRSPRRRRESRSCPSCGGPRRSGPAG